MSALVLLITRDRELTKRLTKSLSEFTEDALTIECVDRLSEATQRLNLNGARAEDAALIADKIRLAVLEPYTIANHFLHLTTSIGVSVYPEAAPIRKH